MKLKFFRVLLIALTIFNSSLVLGVEYDSSSPEDARNQEIQIERQKAEAEANSLKQRTLTPMLLQQQWIEAWRRGGSQVPVYMANGGEKFLMNIK